jgi:hypothetical protein
MQEPSLTKKPVPQSRTHSPRWFRKEMELQRMQWVWSWMRQYWIVGGLEYFDSTLFSIQILLVVVLYALLLYPSVLKY